MMIRTVMLVLALALAASPSAAQSSGDSRLGAMLQAIRLPRATQEARALGVPEMDIRAILEHARQRQLPANVVTEVFECENDAIREHGPVDNFGAFVQGRLDQGLRGRELAAAIRSEHAAHGKGKGHIRAADGDHPGVQGQGGSNDVRDRDRVARPGGKAEARGKAGEGAGKSEAAKGKKGGGR